MQTIRARLAAASAVAVSLGALAAGPAAAQSGSDIGSLRAASLAGAGTTMVTFAAGGMTSGAPIDTRTAATSPDRVGTSSTCAGCWEYIGKYGSLATCRSEGQRRLNVGYADYIDYQCSMVPANGRYEYWLYMLRR